MIPVLGKAGLFSLTSTTFSLNHFSPKSAFSGGEGPLQAAQFNYYR